MTETTQSQKSTKIRITQLIKRGLLELLSVFVAILLALWVDDWHQDRERQKRIELAMASVEKELEANFQSLLKAHAFQSASLEIIKSNAKSQADMDNEDAEALLKKMYARSMYHPTQLLDTAWQVLIQSQLLNYMPHDKVLKYAQHYQFQKELVERQNTHMQTMNDFRLNDKTSLQLLQMYYHTVNEIWWGEKNLLTSFAKMGFKQQN